MHQKLAPDLFLILLNTPKQPLHARKSFKNKTFWKRIIKKPSESWLYFFFHNQSLLMDKVIKNKRGLALATSRFSSHETSSEKFFYSLYIIWPSLMMLCKAVFELFQKLVLQLAYSWRHKLFHFHLSFWIWKLWKGRENYKHFNISRTKRAF